MQKQITELAKVIRSKNCSPFELTMDIIFLEKADYEFVKKNNGINAKMLAAIYNVCPTKINKVVYFDPACAVKICMDRHISSGAPGDTDVYGAQQHGPLLSIVLDIEESKYVTDAD